MLGMYLRIKGTDIIGTVDDQTVQADGKAIVRILDHWFEADQTEAA
ncbi:hypothetical protein QBK99_11085 [Corticibacterium sp. UT-5YL-CI-8]|nr:hypothetical protein [Tianweitania sp. UT-5YL-CI-8]